MASVDCDCGADERGRLHTADCPLTKRFWAIFDQAIRHVPPSPLEPPATHPCCGAANPGGHHAACPLVRAHRETDEEIALANRRARHEGEPLVAAMAHSGGQWKGWTIGN